jgi:hypothetical protein
MFFEVWASRCSDVVVEDPAHPVDRFEGDGWTPYMSLYMNDDRPQVHERGTGFGPLSGELSRKCHDFEIRHGDTG